MGIRKKTGGGGEDRLEGNQLLQCSGKEPIKDEVRGNGSGGAEMGRLSHVECAEERSSDEDLKRCS